MEQEYYRRLIQLEARMHRMETMMQALFVRLGIDPVEVVPQEPEEPPEVKTIRTALLSGEKIKAIKLYREVYGVSLKEAKDAVDTMEENLRG
jgi:ribosomal protein L7/L12